MKLYADVIVKDAHDHEITRFTREETRQYNGFDNMTNHEFYISFTTAISKEIEDALLGE